MSGREAEIDRIIKDESGFVHALALRLAPGPWLAEDIAQQVFLEFVAKAERWDLSRDVRPLLVTMTRYVAQRVWREHRKQRSPHLQQLADHVRRLAEDRESEWYSIEDKAALKECLHKLPAKSSQIIHAYYFLEISTRELAAQLEMSAVAIRQAICRVRQQLRTCMEFRMGSRSDA